jgi:hypothetical protein
MPCLLTPVLNHLCGPPLRGGGIATYRVGHFCLLLHGLTMGGLVGTPGIFATGWLNVKRKINVFMLSP